MKSNPNYFTFSLPTIIIVLLVSLQLNAQSKPNVIVIYTDDQGAIDLGSYGAKDI